MCFDFDSLPPDLPADLRRAPMAGGAGAELIELTSGDGTRFSAALAASPASTGPGVVVLPDIRGLYRFYIELAERFAEAGHDAIAIDYFGRTAGVGERGEDFDAMSHARQTRPEQIQADMEAAIEELTKGATPEQVVSVGFCFGGTHSFLAGTRRELGLDGVVGFYGGLDGSRWGMPSPKDEAVHMRCPVLGLFGGADQGIPPEDVEEFDRSLDVAGVPHEIVVYPGAPHSFFDRKYDEYAEACEDAWRRVLGFLAHLGAHAVAP
ncbi:MAG: dienelactone hydrolase family protein [Solirubrobacterales bacterium]|nr:dienelactone hydrolase family protein [Solirubrobacterales bacterium]